MSKSKIKKHINYLLLYLLIASSGIAYFYHSKDFLWGAIIFVALYFFLKGYKLTKFYFFLTGILIFIQIGQSLVFGEIPVLTFLGMHARLFFAYAVITLIGKKLPDYYIRLMYVFSIISLIFYFVGVLIPGFNEYFVYNISPLIELKTELYSIYKTPPNIIIHCFNTYNWQTYRNSGPFWEPGAFGGFLFIAIFFNTIKEKSLLNKNNIILFITVLTTMSTTSYIVLALFILFYLMLFSRKYLIPTIPIVVFIFLHIFLSQDFLGKKISEQYSNSYVTTYGAGHSITRLTSALLDLQDIKKYPIFGRGRNFKATGFGSLSSFKIDVNHRNNGTFNLMAIYGIPLFILYFTGIFLSFKKYNEVYKFDNKFPIIILFLILILGMSEGYFFLPFFISLSLFNKNFPKLGS